MTDAVLLLWQIIVLISVMASAIFSFAAFYFVMKIYFKVPQ